MVRTLSMIMEAVPLDGAGVAVEHDLPPCELLVHPDLARMLCEGVRLMRDGTAVGWLSPERVASVVTESGAALKAENDAVQAERNALIANLGHELRTPINAILGYSEMLMASLGGKGSGAGYVDVIQEAAQHLLGTIDALLDLTRIEAKELALRESVVDIAGLVRSVGRLLSSAAAGRDIRILSTVPADFPKLRGDARMLRQILINLVTNAIKYTRGETDVILSAIVDRGGYMRIEVRDHGPGIPRNAIKQVMQPFKQLAVHGFAVGGVGLGLPLVKALTELHGGRFRLISAPGEGTRAILLMPPRRVLRAAPALSASSEGSEAGQQVRH